MCSQRQCVKNYIQLVACDQAANKLQNLCLASRRSDHLAGPHFEKRRKRSVIKFEQML